MEMPVGFQLQADLLLGIFKVEEEEQNKENFPPFNAGGSGPPFSFQPLKKRPLQDITNPTATMDAIDNGRRRVSVMEMRPSVDSVAHGRNKKRKIIHISSHGNANPVNPKRPLLAKSFR